MRSVRILGWIVAATTVVSLPAYAQQPSAPAREATARGGLPPTLQVAGHNLRLNGKGTRYRAIIKVYDIGLYVGSKVSSLEQLLAAPGPKRIQIVPLRTLTGDSLGVAMVQGMQDNAPPGERLKLIPHMDRLTRIFQAEPSVSPGSEVVIDFVPGKGTIFYVDGVQKGEVVTDPTYFGAVARIWLGPKPVDSNLKDALLGIEARRPETG